MPCRPCKPIFIFALFLCRFLIRMLISVCVATFATSIASKRMVTGWNCNRIADDVSRENLLVDHEEQ